jgi:hypothetical protein
MRAVYVDESAAPSVPCGASADQPCHSLAAALGASHIKSADYEVREPLPPLVALARRSPLACAAQVRIRPGVYRTSENVGFVFTDSSIRYTSVLGTLERAAADPCV